MPPLSMNSRRDWGKSCCRAAKSPMRRLSPTSPLRAACSPLKPCLCSRGIRRATPVASAFFLALAAHMAVSSLPRRASRQDARVLVFSVTLSVTIFWFSPASHKKRPPETPAAQVWEECPRRRRTPLQVYSDARENLVHFLWWDKNSNLCGRYVTDNGRKASNSWRSPGLARPNFRSSAGRFRHKFASAPPVHAPRPPPRLRLRSASK